jgi:hypothetical protein
MEFRNELQKNLNESKNIMTRTIGNVTEDDEITFEYRLKSIKDLLKLEGFDLTKMKYAYFQTTVNYTNPSGSKLIRIIT